jgi:hypothetical protein
MRPAAGQTATVGPTGTRQAPSTSLGFDSYAYAEYVPKTMVASVIASTLSQAKGRFSTWWTLVLQTRSRWFESSCAHSCGQDDQAPDLQILSPLSYSPPS